MTFISSIIALFKGWADVIAALIVGGLDRLISPKIVRVVERPDGDFLLHPDAAQPDRSIGFSFRGDLADEHAITNLLRGSRMEIVLSPRNFVFRTLDLPLQASDFVEGIVRAQIDRLSPWTVNTATFGCSIPKPIDAARMSTLVAIMPRNTAMTLVQSALDFKPESIAIFAEAEAVDGSRIKVFEQKARGLLDTPTIARGLVGGLCASCVAALLCFVAAQFLGGRLETSREQVAQQIGQSQMLLRAGSDTPQSTAVRALERQKFDTPTITLMLEALTKSLPDHTYLTELHVIGTRLQVVGISRDAPSLIRLIEQAPSFTRATFFAPTTRSASSAGEQFHIEARLEPARGAAQP